MKKVNLVAAVLWAFMLVVAGCGSDHRESGSSPQLRASTGCIGCHSGTTSHVTGNSVVTEWMASAHASAAGGAGCDDCHHVDGHPSNGSIPPLPTDLVCVQCHTNTVTMATQNVHFANNSASYLGLPLSRLSQAIVNPATGDRSASACNGCHNPHDPTSLLPVNRQWAASGHGDTTDAPFDEEPFIKFSGGACSRCHTATGFRWYMTTGAQRVITAATLGAYSSAKEVIACWACHSNYSWRRISSDPAIAFQTYSTPYARFDGVTKRIPGSNFPTADIGDSKVCVPCHAGRTGARAGAAITPLRTQAPFDPHYFPAAATMYGKIGFINFSTPGALTGAYGKSLITNNDISGGVTSTHRKLGTLDIITDSHFSVTNPAPANLQTNGPCVVCHMTAGHTLTFDDPTFLQNSYSQVCINCHTQENGITINAANFRTQFLDENRDEMFAALALAVRFLENNFGITINLTDNEALETPTEVSFVQYPIVDPNNPVSLSNATNWSTYVTTGRGAALTDAQVYKLKGAMFNIILAYKEPASYVHARTITRRLVYDSVDFLDDMSMDQSVSASAVAQSLIADAATSQVSVFGRFQKGAAAFTGPIESSPLAPGTTAPMTYINAFNRSTGAWSIPERP
ncbi:hypothetical protein GMSM_27020 [Geomonas sp. Red276]